jgi:hypothetical protein
MVEAMLAGKTLVDTAGREATYDPDHEEGPFAATRVTDGVKVRMLSGWGQQDWQIKPEPKRRLMIRDEMLGFLANTPGVEMRCTNGKLWRLPSWFSLNEDVAQYEYKIVDLQGNTIKGPCWFEVEE